MIELVGWIANVVLVAGHYYLGERSSFGFFLIIIGEIAWIYPSVKRRSWSMVFLCIVFSLMAVRNFWLWNSA